MAGVTSVPRTKKESNIEQDKRIKEEEKMNQNIIDVVSDKCKIIFPSTHVIYEGIDKVKVNIKEDEIPKLFCPILLQKHSMKSN